MNKIIFEDLNWDAFVADRGNWQSFQRKRYPVKIQKALPDRVYNVPGKPGVVYNILEDCEESIAGANYIVTGLLGEMWPISKKNLIGYDVHEEDIEEAPKLFFTRAADRIYHGIMIPVGISFFVEMPKYGTLKGNANSDKILHGKGDYIVCTSFEEGDYWVVNGQIFHKMYGR